MIIAALVQGPDALRQIALSEVDADDLGEPLSIVYTQIREGADAVEALELSSNEYPELTTLVAHLTVEALDEAKPLTEDGLRGCITYLIQQRQVSTQKNLLPELEEGNLTAAAEYLELVKQRHAAARRGSIIDRHTTHTTE
jgi:hypothetical protein